MIPAQYVSTQLRTCKYSVCVKTVYSSHCGTMSRYLSGIPSGWTAYSVCANTALRSRALQSFLSWASESKWRALRAACRDDIEVDTCMYRSHEIVYLSNEAHIWNTVLNNKNALKTPQMRVCWWLPDHSAKTTADLCQVHERGLALQALCEYVCHCAKERHTVSASTCTR